MIISSHVNEKEQKVGTPVYGSKHTYCTSPWIKILITQHQWNVDIPFMYKYLTGYYCWLVQNCYINRHSYSSGSHDKCTVGCETKNKKKKKNWDS
jgi:hypothetical protein